MVAIRQGRDLRMAPPNPVDLQEWQRPIPMRH